MASTKLKRMSCGTRLKHFLKSVVTPAISFPDRVASSTSKASFQLRSWVDFPFLNPVWPSWAHSSCQSITSVFSLIAPQSLYSAEVTVIGRCSRGPVPAPFGIVDTSAHSIASGHPISSTVLRKNAILGSMVSGNTFNSEESVGSSCLPRARSRQRFLHIFLRDVSAYHRMVLAYLSRNDSQSGCGSSRYIRSMSLQAFCISVSISPQFAV